MAADASVLTAESLALRAKERLGAEIARAIDISGGCGSMFQLYISCSAFEGVSRLKRHRMVNEALAAEVASVHALQLKTLTPAEWEAKKDTLPEEVRGQK